MVSETNLSTTIPPAASLPPYDAVAAPAVHGDGSLVAMDPSVPVPVPTGTTAAYTLVPHAATAQHPHPHHPQHHNHHTPHHLAPPPPHLPPFQEATIQEAATMLTAATNTAGKRVAPHGGNPYETQLQLQPGIAVAPLPSRRKRKRYTAEPPPDEPPLPRGIPYDPADHPALANMDPSKEDHSDLVHAFREPLFPKDPTPTLSIAYSHRHAAVEERKRIRRKKRNALRELKALQEEFYAKKNELLGLNAALKSSSKNVGMWTRKVFDLELAEPCPWNDKLNQLRDYVAKHGRVPEHAMKTHGNEEEKSLATFVAGMRHKVKKAHKNVMKHPHRLAALEEVGVYWESENDARFEAMFQKLLEYKREHGTFRMPSLDLCQASGDEELIALHNWVFSQVGSFRYQLPTKKVETVVRFLDAGFSFEKWYATNGHVYERNIPKFDDFCRRYVENGGVMDPGDVEALKNAPTRVPNRIKRKYKKRKRKGKEEEMAQTTEVVAVAKAVVGGEGGETGNVTENATDEKVDGGGTNEAAAREVFPVPADNQGASAEPSAAPMEEVKAEEGTRVADDSETAPADVAAADLKDGASASDVAMAAMAVTAAEQLPPEATEDSRLEAAAPVAEQSSEEDRVTKLKETAIDASVEATAVVATMTDEAVGASAASTAPATESVTEALKESVASATDQQASPEEAAETTVEEGIIDTMDEAGAAQETNEAEAPTIVAMPADVAQEIAIEAAGGKELNDAGTTSPVKAETADTSQEVTVALVHDGMAAPMETAATKMEDEMATNETQKEMN